MSRSVRGGGTPTRPRSGSARVDETSDGGGSRGRSATRHSGQSRLGRGVPTPLSRSARSWEEGPTLIYDLAVVAQRMEMAREAAREAGVRLLYAVKAFPAREGVEMAVERLDGLDVAGPEEWEVAMGAK